MSTLSPPRNTVVGIYFDLTQEGDALADIRMCLVEAMPNGTLVVSGIGATMPLSMILTHLNSGELRKMLDAIHARRKAA